MKKVWLPYNINIHSTSLRNFTAYEQTDVFPKELFEVFSMTDFQNTVTKLLLNVLNFCFRQNKFGISVVEVYLEPCQKSIMKLFCANN